MPDIKLILIFVILLVVFLVFLRILKTILKTVMLVLTIIFLLSAVFSFFLFSDAADLAKNYASREKLVLLQDKDVITGLIMANETRMLPTALLADYSQKLSSKQYGAVRGNYYKLIIIKKSFVENLSFEKLNISGGLLEKKEILAMIDSSNPEERFYAFANIYQKEIAGKAFVMLKGIKGRAITFYPDTMVFKTIRLLPLPFEKSSMSLVEKLMPRFEVKK